MEKNKYLNLLKEQLNRLNFITSDRFEQKIEIIKDVDVIGFDVDFTLLIYNNKNMTKLIYECMSKYLINYKNYPKEINYEDNKEFINIFSNKNIVLDISKGNALRLSEDKTIIKGFHGKKLLTSEEITLNYPNQKFDSFTKGILNKENIYTINLDSFQPENVPLFMICVDFFDKGMIKNISSYKDIIADNEKAICYNYSVKEFEDCFKKGYYFPEINAHPDLYLFQYNCKNLLKKLKSLGKKLFLATNSNIFYTDYILGKVMGADYQDYFDLCFYKCCKPGFFQDPIKAQSKCKFLSDKSEISCEVLDDNSCKKILKGDKNFSGGSYKIVENYFKNVLKKNELKYLYVGDNIINDCSVPKKLPGWESIFIYDDIDLDFIGERSNYILNDLKNPFSDSNKDKEYYSNTLSLFFKDDNCSFALPNIEGLKYIFE